jgi:hypothetical protein
MQLGLEFEPGHRPPATPMPAPPRRKPRNELKPAAAFRATMAGRNSGTPRPLRSVTSTRTTPPPALTATVTVSPGSPDRLCRTLLPKSSLTSRAASFPHGRPGPRTASTNARAARARAARPATVTLSRTASPVIRAPAFPCPPASRETTRDRKRTQGMHAPLSGPRQAGTRRRNGPFVAVRGKPTVPPTVLTAQTPSAYLHCHVTASGSAMGRLPFRGTCAAYFSAC